MRLAVLGFIAAAFALGHDTDSVHRMVHTANNFLASLEPSQRQAAVFPFEDQERFFWQYIPAADIPKRYGRSRKGIPLLDMRPFQKSLAAALLSAGLSQQGYIKATTIMSLEDVLRVLEKDTTARRDPEKYFFSIFGQPSEQGPWGYRVEGHHVSLHYTIAGGKVMGGPTFFGANPAEVREGPRKGLRVLSEEEDEARALLDSLTPEQKKTAIVSDKAYADILTEASRKAALEGQPGGLPATKMTAAQRKLLANLLAVYAEDVPGELAERRRKQIREAGNNVNFAWAGSTEKGGPHYYRLQTARFLIEYDNTQNGANHIHTVWRDFNGDWGADLLEQHYKDPASHHAKK